MKYTIFHLILIFHVLVLRKQMYATVTILTVKSQIRKANPKPTTLIYIVSPTIHINSHRLLTHNLSINTHRVN
jgi:hypothetical protein